MSYLYNHDIDRLEEQIRELEQKLEKCWDDLEQIRTWNSLGKTREIGEYINQILSE